MGVCVVARDRKTILICVDEVNDDSGFNAFLWVPQEAPILTSMQVKEGGEDPSATHEILLPAEKNED